MCLVLKVCIIGNVIWVGSYDPVMLENKATTGWNVFEFWLRYSLLLLQQPASRS